MKQLDKIDYDTLFAHTEETVWELVYDTTYEGVYREVKNRVDILGETLYPMTSIIRGIAYHATIRS